jgi:hypothetical protein
MEPGFSLCAAMEQAHREHKTFYVFELGCGSNNYKITAYPPDCEVYFKVEPSCVTTIFARRSELSAKNLNSPATHSPVDFCAVEARDRPLGQAFWYDSGTRPQRSRSN